jgi:CRISPR-associated protein Cas1
VRSLVLMEQGLALGVDGERFEIRKDERVLQHVRVADVSDLLLFGSITLTPACISFLLRRGIDTVFLSPRGHYRGRLLARHSPHIELRTAQFAKWHDSAFRAAIARAVVAGKVANQRNLLLRAQRELRAEPLAAAAAEMRRILKLLERPMEVDAVRGLEGVAAAAYFRVFGLCLRNPAFSFSRRTRRPPRDPVNAMLSFGYTMLNTRMESLILRAGLDSMLGAFHAPDFGRPSLALDLIEEFRPLVVDSLVLRLVNRRQVTPEDFEEPLGEADELAAEEDTGLVEPQKDEDQTQAHSLPAVWLGETGRRIFFREWGRRLRESIFYPPRQEVRTLEDIMKLQVYHYARVIRGEDAEYAPFVPR